MSARLFSALSGIEPGLTVILLEDFAAVVGNIMALAMLLISLELNSEVPDACGAILIGVLLGIVALFLIITNATALVGR